MIQSGQTLPIGVIQHQHPYIGEGEEEEEEDEEEDEEEEEEEGEVLTHGRLMINGNDRTSRSPMTANLSGAHTPQDIAFLCIIIGGSGSIIAVCTILGAAWQCKKLELKDSRHHASQSQDISLDITGERDGEQSCHTPGIHANVRKGGFTLSLSLPSVAEEACESSEWVNDRVVQMLSDPNAVFQLGLPQKLKKPTILTPKSSNNNNNNYNNNHNNNHQTAIPMTNLTAITMINTVNNNDGNNQRQLQILNVNHGDKNSQIIMKHETFESHPVELNMQNLAIHQTLMNEAAGVTMKEQIMQNFMRLVTNENNENYYNEFNQV